MKKWIGAMFLVTLMQTAFAQDFKKVETSLLLNNYEAAKTEYNKAVAKKASLETTAEGYYWKSKIYAGLAKDPAAKYPDAVEKLYKSLEDYIKADPEYALAVKSGQEPFFEVYLKSFKDGVAAFGEKKWKDAAANFDRGVILSDIIFTKGWSSNKQPFDTTTLMYAGYANQNAGNEETTIKHYTRMIDANLKSDDLIDVYKYVLIKAKEKKDKALFDKYYAVSERNYPNEKWFEFKADYIESNLTIDEKMLAYDTVLLNGTATEIEHQLFGDLFMSARNSEGMTDEKENILFLKALSAYKNSFKLNQSNSAVAFNIGVNYYNQYGTIEEKLAESRKALQTLNANKPTDPKKKLVYENKIKPQVDSIKKVNLVIEADLKAKLDSTIYWTELAFNIIESKEELSKQDKNVGSRAVDLLATFYLSKADKARGKDLKLVEEMEKKYNKYDLLHDAFEVKIGSTKKQVYRLMGKPNSISTTVTKSNSSELFIYNKVEIGFDKNGIVDYMHDIK